jgi:hypothetical protein
VSDGLARRHDLDQRGVRISVFSFDDDMLRRRARIDAAAVSPISAGSLSHPSGSR